ncbi:gem-associated protein 2-like [Aricia agestis]|uniref:gem-associated protein 2-like n=1 Tax=Aricia agestis TaxID=91739 RepID=UPI001C20A699|nr:gem-associated protein 2-like [Aricia agestis]
MIFNMSTKKIVYKSTKEHHEETDSLSSPCFQINSDVELKETPTTGEEYLLKVINERRQYSFVTRCNKDYTKYARNQSCFVNEMPHAKAPEVLVPTIEWQNIQVADFSDTRMYISRMLAKKSLWPTKVKKIDINPNNIGAWKSLFQNEDPSLSSLIGAHSAVIDRGLEILVDVLDHIKPGNTITHRTGQWIYALLACIRQPLLSDTISIIRDLARKCAEIRVHLDPESEETKVAVAPLNIFICLIARYFRQYDLAD